MRHLWSFSNADNYRFATVGNVASDVGSDGGSDGQKMTGSLSKTWWEDRIRALGCAACHKEGFNTPADIHHIRSWDGQPAGLSNRGHGEYLILPLCYFHHQGELSIHGSPLEFKQAFGTEVDLFNETLERLVRELSGR